MMLQSNNKFAGGAGVVDTIRLPDPSESSFMPTEEELNEVKSKLQRRLQELQKFEERAKQNSTDLLPSTDKELTKVVHTCQQIGLIPLPSFLNEKQPEAKELYKYVDENDRVCVAKEFVDNQPRKRSKAQILNSVLDMVKDYKEAQDKKAKFHEGKDDDENYEQKYRIEGDDDLAFKHCVSKTTAEDCSVEECEAFKYGEKNRNGLMPDDGKIGTDFTTNVRDEELTPADNTTEKTAPVACVPKPRLHLNKMERIQKTILIKTQALKTLRGEIKKLTNGLRQEQISALQTFVLPSFHARQTESAETVLKEKREQITKLETQIRHFKLLYNKYARIAATMNIKNLQLKTLDEACQTAETSKQCNSINGCQLYDVSPVDVWSKSSETDGDEPLTKPSDPYAKYIGSQQCRAIDALTKRKIDDDQVDTGNPFGLSGGSEAATAAAAEEELKAAIADYESSQDPEPLATAIFYAKQAGLPEDNDIVAVAQELVEIDTSDDSSAVVRVSDPPTPVTDVNQFLVVDTKPYDFGKLNASLLFQAYGSGDMMSSRINENREWINTITNKMERLYSSMANYNLFCNKAHRTNDYDLTSDTITAIKLDELNWKPKNDSDTSDDKDNVEDVMLMFLPQASHFNPDSDKLLEKYKTNAQSLQTHEKVAKEMFLRLFNILKLAKEIREDMEAATKTSQKWQLWRFFQRFFDELFQSVRVVDDDADDDDADDDDADNVPTRFFAGEEFDKVKNYVLSSPFDEDHISNEGENTTDRKCLILDFYENVLRSMYRPSFVGQQVMVNTEIIDTSKFEGRQFIQEEEEKNRIRNLPIDGHSYRKGHVLKLKKLIIYKDGDDELTTQVPDIVAFEKFGTINDYYTCQLKIDENNVTQYGNNVLSRCPNPKKCLNDECIGSDGTGTPITTPYYVPKDQNKNIYKNKIRADASYSDINQALNALKDNTSTDAEANAFKDHPIYAAIKVMYETFLTKTEQGAKHEKVKAILMTIARHRMRDATNADEFLNRKGTFTVLEAGGTSHEVDYVTPNMNIVSLEVFNTKPTMVEDSVSTQTIQMERV